MAEQITGFKELSKALKEMDPRKQVNAIRGAARAALKPVEQAAKANAPVGDAAHKTYRGRWVAPGHLRRNINRTSYKSRDGFRVGATVGTKKEAFYGRMFVEVGTAHMSPQPWLRTAYASNKSEMISVFKRELRKHIIKQAKKVRKPRRR